MKFKKSIIKNIMIKNENQIMEKLAELEHEQWVTWSKAIVESESISDERMSRWHKLWKPYAELSDQEKESDRKWALKVLHIITKQ